MSAPGICVLCDGAEATGVCCTAHGKRLCHRCYRRTHFVEICTPGCPDCDREGLKPVVTYGAGCRCDWLGEGTPEHAPSPLCRSLRPDADRDEEATA